MESTKAKGAGFLKVTGILMIIGGAISVILGIIAALGVAPLCISVTEPFHRHCFIHPLY